VRVSRVGTLPEYDTSGNTTQHEGFRPGGAPVLAIEREIAQRTEPGKRTRLGRNAMKLVHAYISSITFFSIR
jgi:hypothetical protein